MARVRIGAAQLNLLVGDLDGNVTRVLAAYERAAAAGCDLVAFPELAITGYPPEDLLLRPSFIEAAVAGLDKIATCTSSAAAIIGFPERHDGALYNSAAVAVGGRVVGVYRKHLLPNFAVFDEERYFEPWTEDGPLFSIAGVRVGCSICEDAWSPTGPVLSQARGGADLVININASPYYAGRVREREMMLSTRAIDAGVPIVYLNLVGGQDELVFDGASMVIDERGQVIARARSFTEDLLVVDLDMPVGRRAPSLPEIQVSPAGFPDPPVAPRVEPVLGPVHEVYEALVLGTRDYVDKNSFEHVLLGLSGGVDSALVATIATDALGAERVTGVLLPSRFSSEGSVRDAETLAANLGIATRTIPIEPAHQALLEMLAPAFGGTKPGIAEENLQARIRGTLVMALANKFGWIVLTTGNKSEFATGYSTLYGDMAGGFSVIKDVPKTLVYALARDRNERAGRDLIPDAILDKPPSAELRPDQKDSDSLPDYAVLDTILEGYVERDRSIADLVADGFDEATVRRVARLVDRNEYKRRQSPPGIRVSPKAFGKDRRLPITNAWPG